VTTPIRVFVVDDHEVLREGIRAILEPERNLEIVGTASNGLEAVQSYERLRPDVTLMDLEMPVMDGLEAIAKICEIRPQARIVVLTTYRGDVQAVRALKAGASGYLLKSSLIDELLTAIRLVHAGQRYIPGEIAQEIAYHAAEDSLSEKEVAVLQLVAQGKANKTVAWELKLSEETIKAHLKNIYSKLSVNDRTQAVTTALRRGIIAL
jgi:DNA-binding NarL/FixJ family response regulator